MDDELIRGSHALHALRRKRAEIAGLAADHDRKAKAAREALAHLDATLKLFDPEVDPTAIPPKRPHHRTRYFPGSQLARFILDTLRTAEAPLSAVAICEHAAKTESVPDQPHVMLSLRQRIINYLNDKEKCGEVMRIGPAHNALWTLPTNT